MTRWYRAYEGTVTDPKLGEVALVAGCSRSVAIAAWHCILESCAVSNDGGNFDATLRRVAVILGEPLQIIESVFSELENLKMIEGPRVTSWIKRQFESDNSTARSKKHRENKAKENATETQRCATPPETDPETDPKEIINPDGLIAEADASADVIRIERDRKKIVEERSALRLLGQDWNSLASEYGLAQIEEIDPGSPREKHALARIREGRDFPRAFTKIRASPFLRGDKGSTPCCFDWIIKPLNFQKIIEGNYDEIRKANSQRPIYATNR